MIRPKPIVRRIDTSSISLGKVPPKASVIKESSGQKIEKLCSHSEWQPRVLWMTVDKLLITHLDEEDISDQIPLVPTFDCVLMKNMLTMSSA